MARIYTKISLPGIVFLLLTILCAASARSQDSTLQRLIVENRMDLNPEGHSFTGPGWDFIAEKSRESQHVLVGEDHFSNEIPGFVRALGDVSRFDYFYIEVDPYSTRILEQHLRETDPVRKSRFMNDFGQILSFCSLVPEYHLAQHMSDKGARLLGSDQVVMYDDRLIFTDWAEKTASDAARLIYSEIIAQSKNRFEKFLEKPEDFMSIHFMTPEFSNQLTRLESLDISEAEKQIVEDMRRSIRIYREQDHALRVRLILNGLMRDYPLWSTGRTLFKYGANHMMRGESLLTVYDIGNVVANLAGSRYQETCHIMIVGKSGTVGTIFEPIPPSPVDPEGFYLKHLAPFLQAAPDGSWQVFDLVPIRNQLEKGALALENENLARTLKGYDALVIIPELTPAALNNPPK